MPSWRSGFLSAAIALSAGSASAGIIEGETFQWEFEVHVMTGPLEGMTFHGDLSYTLPASDIRGGPVLLDHVNFAFDGNLFTKEDDIDFPSFPTALFSPGGEFLGIDYVVSYFSPPPRSDADRVFGFSAAQFSYDIDVFDTEPNFLGTDDPTAGEGFILYRLIPAPGAAAMLGLLAIGAARRRR